MFAFLSWLGGDAEGVIAKGGEAVGGGDCALHETLKMFSFHSFSGQARRINLLGG